MWSLYNSYHYASLDRRKNKDEKINCQTIKPKKSENFYSCSIPNTKGQNFNDIFCQGNHFSKPKDKETEIDSDDAKKFKGITPLSHHLWEKSVKEANLRKKHGKNVGEIYNESCDMQFRELPDEHESKNNPYRPKLFEELDSNDLSWMTNIPQEDIHPNLTLEQQYYHLKDMEKYYMVNLWRTKWEEIRPEQDYWYELRDNTFWREARRNRLSAYDPDVRSYFLNNVKEFYHDQKLHYDKYKSTEDFENSNEYKEFLKEYSLNPFEEDNKDMDIQSEEFMDNDNSQGKLYEFKNNMT